MKNIIATLMFVAFFVPNVSLAAVNPGVEFLSPLVQTIITLLQDRIGVLNAENNALRAGITALRGGQAVNICGVSSNVPTKTPQERANELNALEANRIRFEFNQRIADIESKMRELQLKLITPETSFECGGYGCPMRTQGIKDTQAILMRLDSEKHALEVERAKQLASVGVF
jgi:hypothetical protein